MSVQHFNAVKAIARAASQLGAQLPDDITTALAHLETITTGRAAAPQAGPIAKELARHLGNPAAMEKAHKAAALELATAEARAKIDTYLAEACGSRLRGMMRDQGQTIAAAFGDALAPSLDTLTATAGRLPAWFNPDHAAGLDADTFKAWTQARDAYANIQAAQSALAPLYTQAVANIEFPHAAAASLRFAKPPALKTARQAYAFRDALMGKAERVQGLAGQGSTFVDGIFIPTALAHAGATFEWATPDQVTQRARATEAAMTRPEPARV